MTENAPKAPDRVYYVGIILTAISFLVFCFPLVPPFNNSGNFAIFCINFFIAIWYYIKLWNSGGMRYYPVFLVLFLISAYSLNRSITMFENSADWLSVALVIFSVNYLVLPFIDRMPVIVRRLMAFLLGGALLLFIYLSLYLLPLSPFFFLGGIFLGISLHGFVPLLFVYFTARWFFRQVGSGQYYTWLMATGIGLSVLIAVVFVQQWSAVDRVVERDYWGTTIADNTDLPAWANVAEHLPDTWITQKYLKSNMVYTIPGPNFFNFSWNAGRKNFDEGRRHDPLVFLAAWFGNALDMEVNSEIKILTSTYATRHQAEDRLWNGANLYTRNIITNVRIWPEQRLAYTEKTITVLNSGTVDWRNKEEAIYTFHSPEGGVVTSLSLWIDGVEQKGVLTTTQKADAAYKHIVGVEYHDPSLVHWHEGNTVSVRVFPVIGHNTRTFKIGITAPLTFTNNKLVYDNIWFQGPDCTGATETQQIDWAAEPREFSMPEGFSMNGAHRYIREHRKYDPDFQLTFADPGIQPDTFNFAGYSYSVKPYISTRQAVNIRKVYLDLNNSWTEDELEQVFALVKDKEVFVCNQSPVPLNEELLKKHQFTNVLLKQRFSLFPFFAIDDNAASLIITKSPMNSPNLADLKGSQFAVKLEKKMQDSGRIKLFNIGNQLSPYLKSLKEHRSFDFEQGDIALLKQLLDSHVFAVNNANDSQVVINSAGITLTRSADTTRTKAIGPDHLMRLFAYNHIMAQLKNKLFSNADPDDTLVSEVQKACIVTPVSSLIVLESQEQYKSFDISKSKDALDDASLKSNGAVPEPGEWALIILAVVVLAWVAFRHYLQKKSFSL